MPAKITLRDARLERMRGRLDDQLIAPKEKPTKPPEPIAKDVQISAPVTVDTSPIAQAMHTQAQMFAQAMQELKQEPGVPAPTKWSFRITERDRRTGDVIAFTAEASS